MSTEGANPVAGATKTVLLPSVVLDPEDPKAVVAEPTVTPVTVMLGDPVRPPEVPVVFWFSVGNVQFVRAPDAGVPSTGAVKVLFDSVSAPVGVT